MRARLRRLSHDHAALQPTFWLLELETMRVAATARMRRSTRPAIFQLVTRWHDQFVRRETVLGHALRLCPSSPLRLAVFLQSPDERPDLLALKNFSYVSFF